GASGAMNTTFLSAGKSHGGPGATIHTAMGTTPPHVNPPAERETAPTTIFSLASTDSSPASPAGSTVQVASATGSGGVGGFFSKLFGSTAADQDAPSTQPALVSKPKRTAAVKPGQSAAPRPKHEPAETKTATPAAHA